MKILDRIACLRRYMMAYGIGAVLLDDADPHLGEYVPEGYRSRTFISGFDGSYGRLVIMLDRAALWTDSRYYLQAEKQLKGTGIELIPVETGILLWEWVIDCFAQNKVADFKTVVCDGWQFSYQELQVWRKGFLKNDIQLKSDFDLWHLFPNERPLFSKELIRLYDLKFSGESFFSKRASVLSLMNRRGEEAIFLSSLDEVAWMLNLRGGDLPYNPFFSSYLYLTVQEAILFVDLEKLSEPIESYLAENGVQIRAYDEVKSFFPANKHLSIDPKKINAYLGQRFSELGLVAWNDSVVAPIKAVENKTQIENLRLVSIADGVAVVRTLYWLECELSVRKVSEYEVGERLSKFRSVHPHYMEESFYPIVAYGPNAAVVHYHATESNHSVFGYEGILLIDSGGQYLEATTDGTRTIAFGEVPDQLKRDYTLVLKGHIALSMACFPEGTPGCRLDLLARQFLWQEGLNYGHGTGHGIGSYSSVHEGPQNIRSDGNQTPLQAGMLLSNEPGLYRAGEYGIRIENMVLVVSSDKNGFLEFETITLLPYDRRLIKVDLLTGKEIEWINCYHKRVYENLSPSLSEQERLWLERITENINIE